MADEPEAPVESEDQDQTEQSDDKPAAKKSTPRKNSRSKPGVNYRELFKGSENSDDVRKLQEELIKAGAPMKVEVTGTYDGLTQAAVRWWQNENGFTGGRGLRLDEKQTKKLFG